MTNPRTDDVIELVAVNRGGALACDTSIATPEARDGLGAALRAHILGVRSLPNGVEVRFASEGWEDVRRYVDLESRCCSFLTLRMERRPDGVLLTVTGRPDAKPWIDQIFA